MTNITDGTEVTISAPNRFKVFTLAAGATENYRLPSEVKVVFLTGTAMFLVRASEEDLSNPGFPLYEATLTNTTIEEGSELSLGSIEYNVSRASDNFISVTALTSAVQITMTMYS
jgi:hypothetical protein